MYIIVVGGGEVGYYLAKTLLNDEHEVLIIEKDARECEIIAEQLGSVVTRGDGCEVATLDDVGTGRAGVLIAVTGDDEDNLVSCQVAKHKFNVPRTIARIKDPRNETLFRKLGVDVTISSTNLILAHIKRELPSHPLIPLLTLKGGSLEVVDVKIPPDSSVVGRRLGDLAIPAGSVICLIIDKKTGAQIPMADTVLGAEDEIVAVTSLESEAALRAALTGI